MAFATDAQRRWWFAHLAHDKPAAEAWMTREFQPWGDALSDEDRERLRDYQNMEYQGVSSYLRGRMGALDNPANASKARDVKALDRLFSHAPTLSEPVTVFRGISAAEAATLRRGMAYSDQAFQSTSLQPETAMRFSRDGGAVLQIDVPSGTPVLPFHVIDRKRQSPEAEFELLLPRGRTYRVKAVHPKILHGRTVIQLEAKT